ncbi:hypothetical protein [Micromonospora sp. NBS 11-29]|uniref:hypothetical protein n=1 Tax=Micromonospora sp. NBS 11-29 TaxID=1960879 RepID=UPI000B79AC1F|nr:hypothetical protein [Micromonospora sp. NBS 11-29]
MLGARTTRRSDHGGQRLDRVPAFILAAGGRPSPLGLGDWPHRLRRLAQPFAAGTGQERGGALRA